MNIKKDVTTNFFDAMPVEIAEEVQKDLNHTWNQARISEERIQLAKLKLDWVKRWQIKNFEFFPIPHSWFVDLYLKHFASELNADHPRIHAMRILSSPAWEITEEIYKDILRLEEEAQEKERKRRESTDLIQQVQNRLLEEDDRVAQRTILYQSPTFFQKMDLFQNTLEKIPPSMWENIPVIMKTRIESFKPIGVFRFKPDGKPSLQKLSINGQIEVIQGVLAARNYDKAALYVSRFNEVNINLTFKLELCQVNNKPLLQRVRKS